MGNQSDLLAAYERPNLHPAKFARRLMGSGGGRNGSNVLAGSAVP
jgi:hypothetical protein